MAQSCAQVEFFLCLFLQLQLTGVSLLLTLDSFATERCVGGFAAL